MNTMQIVMVGLIINLLIGVVVEGYNNNAKPEDKIDTIYDSIGGLDNASIGIKTKYNDKSLFNTVTSGVQILIEFAVSSITLVIYIGLLIFSAMITTIPLEITQDMPLVLKIIILIVKIPIFAINASLVIMFFDKTIVKKGG